MPMHDWTKVEAYIYHDFHTSWICEIRNALNQGVLPEGYYALAEQSTKSMGPDVIALNRPSSSRTGNVSGSPVMTLDRPQVAMRAEASFDFGTRQKRVAIRHRSGDEIVAIIELVSPGNKAGKAAISNFIRKITTAVQSGIHAVVIDPFPPGPRDPEGIHNRIWPRLGGSDYEVPEAMPLTLASYEAVFPPVCYVQPFAVGQLLPTIPVFLDDDFYVTLSLEPAYQMAIATVLPHHLQLLKQ